MESWPARAGADLQTATIRDPGRRPSASPASPARGPDSVSRSPTGSAWCSAHSIAIRGSSPRAPGATSWLGIGELYSGLGLTARRYGEALRAFVRSCTDRPAPTRQLPGSYAHARRRQDAEAVWASGGSFEDGLAAALANPPPGLYGIALPSYRTVRRWWLQRRWLHPPVGRRVALDEAA